jgi:hypothetical protein
LDLTSGTSDEKHECMGYDTDGERSDINFSSGKYKAVYDKHLANLRKFIHERKPMGSLIPSSRTLMSMGAEVTFNIFISLCLTYYYRTHTRVVMMDVTCGDYLSDVEISNAIQESMQECDGGNQSDSVDEVDSESDDNGEDK